MPHTNEPDRRLRAPWWRAAARAIACAIVLAGGTATAQTLGEVVLVTAIASQLHPVSSLPSGTMRAQGAGADAFVARLPGHAQWTDWEVFTVTGLLTALEPALVRNVETEFMLAGLERASREETTIGSERHVRYEFRGSGPQRLLYVVRTGDSLVWALARAR